MKNFRKICIFVIVISVILDIWVYIALMFSNGFVGAAVSRGSNTVGLTSYITNNLGEILFVLVPILFVVWIYVSSNKEKYPKFEIIMTAIVTTVFIIPWLFTFITVKLSDQKFTQDKTAFEASGKVIQIGSCVYKVFPDNSWGPRGNVPGQTCTDPEGTWMRTYPTGVKY